MRRKVFWGTSVVLFVVIAGSLGAILAARPHQSAKAIKNAGGKTVDEEDDVELIRDVDVIRPRADPSFVLSVKEIADVQAYYSVPLMAEASGRVKRVTKGYGDPVVRGETLVEIDVPELVTAVEQKEQVILQREKEMQLAREKAEVARIHIQVTEKTILERQAEVETAVATRTLKLATMERYRDFAEAKGSSRLLAIETQRDYETAVSLCKSSEAAVEKAIADSREAEASYHATEAEYRVKESLVEVAKKDRKLAEDMASYTRVRAPFDGVIVDRKVNEGDLVQNATTGRGKSLLTVARTDIVTVVMKVPDRFAHFVSQDTKAIVQVGDMIIQGQVTSNSPTVDREDRTMHVEVDLFNRTGREEYERFVRQLLGNLPASAASLVGANLGTPALGRFGCGAVTAACVERASEGTWVRIRKGIDDPLPLFPRITGKGLKGRREPLLPGDVGRMRLILKEFGQAYLVPSDVVFWRGGQTYIAMVRDGKVHLVEVDVQADDTKLAKIQLIEQEKTLTGEEEQTYRELTGDEPIIRGGQAELNEGQEVRPTAKRW